MTVPTLGDLLADVRSHLDESSAALRSDAELLRWIAEGLRDVARRAEILSKTQTFNIVANQEEYALPLDLIRIWRVEFAFDVTQTYKLGFRDYNAADEIWWTSKRVPGNFPLFYTLVGTPGIDLKLRMYPIPSANYTNGLIVYYYRLPTFSNPPATTDVAEIPAGWEDLVVLYCEVVARRKDNDPQWEDAKALYEERLQALREVTRRYADTLGMITTPAPRWPWWFGTEEDWS